MKNTTVRGKGPFCGRVQRNWRAIVSMEEGTEEQGVHSYASSGVLKWNL